MFLRTQGCHNCAFASPSIIARRVTCTHEPTPALLATDRWPVVYGDDVCGYWRAPDPIPSTTEQGA